MGEVNEIFKHPEVERIVRDVTWQFLIDGHERDDLKQIARMAIFERLFPKHPISLENLNTYLGLMYRTAQRALTDAFRRSWSEKVLYLTKARSIYETPGKESPDVTYTFERFFGTTDTEPLHVLCERERLLSRLEHAKLKSLEFKNRECIVEVLHLVCDILRCSKKELIEKSSTRLFEELGLGHWLRIFFKGSPYRALKYAFPKTFVPHELPCVPKGYWAGKERYQHAGRSLQHALESSGVSKEDYPKILSVEFFRKNKLERPLNAIYSSNRFAYLNDTFPGVYHPWELPESPYGFFDEPDHVVDAVRWLVEEKLDIPINELTRENLWAQGVAKRITKDVFLQHGLAQIMDLYGAPGPVLRMAYPDKWFPWSFNKKGMWQGEEGRALAVRAVRWCLEEYLRLDPRTTKITWAHLGENGFAGMMRSPALGFGNRVRMALENAYPEWVGQFK